MAQEIDHVDLWREVDTRLRNRKTGEVKVSWTKGHAMPRHLSQGLTTEEDIWGNNAADWLAGVASAEFAKTGESSRQCKRVQGG
eukprot:gene57075-biopygen1085